MRTPSCELWRSLTKFGEPTAPSSREPPRHSPEFRRRSSTFTRGPVKVPSVCGSHSECAHVKHRLKQMQANCFLTLSFLQHGLKWRRLTPPSRSLITPFAMRLLGYAASADSETWDITFVRYRDHLGPSDPRLEKESKNNFPGPLGLGAQKSKRSRRRAQIECFSTVLTLFSTPCSTFGVPGREVDPGNSFSGTLFPTGPEGPKCQRPDLYPELALRPPRTCEKISDILRTTFSAVDTQTAVLVSTPKVWISGPDTQSSICIGSLGVHRCFDFSAQGQTFPPALAQRQCGETTTSRQKKCSSLFQGLPPGCPPPRDLDGSETL